MSEDGSRTPVVILAIVFAAAVFTAAGALLALTLSGGAAPVDVGPSRPPPEPLFEEPEPEPAPAPLPEDVRRVRRHANEPADAPAAPDEPAGDEIVVTKADFLARYRDAFAREAGRQPSAEQEEAAWVRSRGVVAGVPYGAGGQDGRVDAENRRTVEIGERDDIMTFLTTDRRSDLRALRNDPAALERLFAHRVTGPGTDGPARLAGRTDLVDDGTTLVFGPGVHTPSWEAIGERGPKVPRDLTIQGAGMDKTLIRLKSFSGRDVLWNLHLRDCTIDCGNDGAFDLRNREASVLAERVRFVRFDAGHGGCYVLACNQGAAFYAKSCVFAGGYGRSPGHGSLLRWVKLARFEDCTFERITYRVIGGYNDADAVAFVRCTFRDCPDDIAALQSEARSRIPPDVVVTDCVAEWTIPEERRGDGEAFARDLGALFPGAGER